MLIIFKRLKEGNSIVKTMTTHKILPLSNVQICVLRLILGHLFYFVTKIIFLRSIEIDT